jgi:hypothetical protein
MISGIDRPLKRFFGAAEEYPVDFDGGSIENPFLPQELGKTAKSVVASSTPRVPERRQ